MIPYVNERQAFGEPISNRQAVAFTVSDIAIELEGMKLTTWRAASRADLGKSFAKEATIARQLVADAACRSAPAACSCWAATATSRNIPSNAGTAICAPPA